MAKKSFVVIFVITQLFFIFFHIHKQSMLIGLSYEKQKYEKLKNDLLLRRQELIQKQYVTHSRSANKTYGQDVLGLKTISLTQVKQ